MIRVEVAVSVVCRGSLRCVSLDLVRTIIRLIILIITEYKFK